jgi:hypothetical protein
MNDKLKKWLIAKIRRTTAYCLLLTAFMFFLFAPIKAQETAGGVKVLARPYPDSIQLRWAPTSYELWQAGLKNGYIIERYTILSKKELVKQSLATKKVFDVVKPWPRAQWEPLVDTNKYVGIAAEAIFGENFTVNTGKTGTMYDIVNLSTEQSNRFSFALFSADMSTLAARAMGLFFTDKSANKDESYLYRVMINGYTTQKIDTGYVLSGYLEYRPLPRPSQLSVHKQGKNALLAWDRLSAENAYTAYIIERSINNSGYKPLNAEPLINPMSDENERSPFFTYSDTLPNELVKMQYRICGISPFGERGPWSDTASLKGGPVLTDYPVINLYESKDTKTATIGWTFPKENKAVTGFRIMRSNTDVTGFKDISGLLPSKTRVYTDTVPLPTNYYKVFAIGQSGDITMSLAVLVQPVDSFPPVPPVRLAAKVDSTGKVTLHWKANTEPDMFGYRANNLNEEFSQLTVAPFQDTVYYDKINIKTLTHHIYYKLMAIDKRQNHSGFSDYLDVKRPDFIPPVRPVFKEVHSDARGIYLSWSSSTSDDVASQELRRYANDSTKQTLVARFTDMNIETFIDSTALGDTIYHYRFIAIDESGNRSVPAIIAAVSGRKPNTDIILKATAFRNKGIIELVWNAPAVPGIVRYIIYRGMGEEAIATYTAVNAPLTKFTEQRPIVGTKYTFAVRVMFKNGALGSVSVPVVIEY